MNKTPYRYVPIVSDLYRFVKRRLTARAYAGENVACPVCSRQFRSWKAGGSCPYCDSATRHKAAVLWLEDYLAHRIGTHRTLLFAPDFGIEAWLRRNPKIELTTTDYSAPRVDYHWDIVDIPAKAESYDLILCSHVMEHIPDDAAAFGELARILSKNGTILLQIPYSREEPLTDEDDSVTDPEERVRRFGQFDHVRRYGRDITDRMRAQNLSCEVLELNAWLGAERMDHLALWNDVLFVCRHADAAPSPGAVSG